LKSEFKKKRKYLLLPFNNLLQSCRPWQREQRPGVVKRKKNEKLAVQIYPQQQSLASICRTRSPFTAVNRVGPGLSVVAARRAPGVTQARITLLIFGVEH